jgi:phage terminase large subunit
MTANLPFDFDFIAPDYSRVFAHRAEKLRKIRNNPECISALKIFYRHNPAQFIIDWGCTFDPRNIERDLPAIIPFMLFQKQIEWIDWVVFDMWQKQEKGTTVKSRDMGVSWLSVALGCTLSIFNDDLVVGYGSRKEEYVDKLGDPKSMFWKAREFVKLLPKEFRGGFTRDTAPHMRIQFPHSKSAMIGEAGDNIGRGNRASIYFVDEFAFIERPKMVDAALSQTTNCRIDVSTPNGPNNPFAERVRAGKNVFRFHWRDDPRKDEDWYQRQLDSLDPVTVAQEVDMDFNASIEGVLIPQRWVQASIDAHIKLGFDPTGELKSALDVADKGKDTCAQSFIDGILLKDLDEWKGKTVEDIFGTTERAINNCAERNIRSFRFDAGGLGAGVTGDSRKINEERKINHLQQIQASPFNGASAVVDKDLYFIYPSVDMEGVKNGQFFYNYKAQSYWSLRDRFKKTFEMVEGIQDHPYDELISISSKCKNLSKATLELSQPTYKKSGNGKVVIDKAPDDSASPNLADCIMMGYAPTVNNDFSGLL